MTKSEPVKERTRHLGRIIILRSDDVLVHWLYIGVYVVYYKDNVTIEITGETKPVSQQCYSQRQCFHNLVCYNILYLQQLDY